MRAMDMSVCLASGLTLKNPIINASGTFAYGQEFSSVLDLSSMGAIITKGLSLMPKQGNPTPRIAEAPCGMINAVGLENIGSKAFVDERLAFLSQFDTHIIVNFFAQARAEYVVMADRLNVDGISGLEMNVSCPNVSNGGIEFGRDPDGLFSLVRDVRAVTSKPLIVKLSPMVTDITLLAQAAASAGADGLTCINTIPAMAIDCESWRPILGNSTGGLSGPAIKPVALKAVFDCSRCVDIPVIGCGGVSCAADVIEFMLAGAAAVETGSASLRDPFIFESLLAGIQAYMEAHNIGRLSDITGELRIP
ncbi:MAG: dihydroorotate dehydrogenase [Thermodesulfobacteriota bacterium]|nr:dihydroorotate dehydrogenase [Thermodesulfobacteriota bacterium]